MMTEKELRERLHGAMRERNTTQATVLRGVLAALKNKSIENRGRDISDADIAAVIKREVKQCREGLEFAIKAERTQLADEGRANLEVLEGLLPEQLSEAELREAIQAILAETAATAIGPVMKQLGLRYAARYDGKTASRVAAELLSKG